MAFLAARPPAPCIDVLQGTDMRYRRPNPRVSREGRKFTFRRPDSCVLRCIEPGARLRSDDVIVAVEITSSDDDVDFNDKRAEYAAQGIPVFLIAVMADARFCSIEEHRLDGSGRNYQLAAVHRNHLVAEFPERIKLDSSFAALERI